MGFQQKSTLSWSVLSWKAFCVFVFFEALHFPGGPPHICEAGGFVEATYSPISAGRWKRKQPHGAAELAAALCMWHLNKMPQKIYLLEPAFFLLLSFLCYTAPQQMLGLLLLYNILGTAHKTKSKLAHTQVRTEWLQRPRPRVKANIERSDEWCAGARKHWAKVGKNHCESVIECLSWPRKYLVRKPLWRHLIP